MNSNNKSKNLFIHFDNITVRLRGRSVFENTNWIIEKGHNWVVIGPNGSGKSTLMRALMGELPLFKGEIKYFFKGNVRENISYVSFENHKRIILREKAQDEVRYFAGKLDEITLVKNILQNSYKKSDSEYFNFIIKQTGVRELLNKGIKCLSTGEVRKVLIAKAIINRPKLLILDEPFDGLDSDSIKTISCFIQDIAQNTQIILVSNRYDEILPIISHGIFLKDCKMIKQGNLKKIFNCFTEDSTKILLNLPNPIEKAQNSSPVLIKMENIHVRYGKTTILNNISWTVKQNENWAIVGPNGSGKSTLLSLISGDNTQAYANKIYLFGQQRGTGESIWDIKQKIGFVSCEFQINYKKKIKAFEVVLSGFFDSIGLYNQASKSQKNRAAYWMEILGISNLAQTCFDYLSYGQQRMVLIARAMVKSPQLLILDEPCQGLDIWNRQKILQLIEHIGKNSLSTLLYVTHHKNEIVPSITKFLELYKPV